MGRENLNTCEPISLLLHGEHNMRGEQKNGLRKAQYPLTSFVFEKRHHPKLCEYRSRTGVRFAGSENGFLNHLQDLTTLQSCVIHRPLPKIVLQLVNTVLIVPTTPSPFPSP